MRMDCPQCRGDGTVGPIEGNHECSRCLGTGLVTVPEPKPTRPKTIQILSCNMGLLHVLDDGSTWLYAGRNQWSEFQLPPPCREP